MTEQQTTTAEQELEVLMPDRTLSIAGKQVKVCELRFKQQIEHFTALQTIAKTLENVSSEQLVSDDMPTITLDVLMQCWTQTIELLTVCTNLTQDEIEALPATEAETLLLVWWNVNQNFFIRRLARPLALAQARAEQLTGDESLASSSVQDTVTLK